MPAPVPGSVRTCGSGSVLAEVRDPRHACDVAILIEMARVALAHGAGRNSTNRPLTQR